MRVVIPLVVAGILAAIPVAASAAATVPVSADPAGGTGELAARLCGALAGRVDAIPGAGPVFLRSYDGPLGQGPTAEPTLSNAAFTYDNALAAIALVACGQPAKARRIGEALLSAARRDRNGGDGRLRNTYRAGGQAQYPIPPMGWWDEATSRWLEDAYHLGTATGNVAWAALALLTVNQASGDARFRDGAAALAHWAVIHTRSDDAGFTGGVHGFDGASQPLTWKSVEHNTDLIAVFDWLSRDPSAPGPWVRHAGSARAFLDAAWDAPNGRFFVGTLPDGVTINRAVSGLDAQLWPMLLQDAPKPWQQALAYAERAHGVDGGFDFNDDRDGVWLEGTAQAALAYRAAGRPADAERLLAGLSQDIAPGGYVWATRQTSITTGLAIGPSSTTDDFRYFRRPHLGATAWAALAALSWNPFVGRTIP